MSKKRYPQFCALARAAEILGERWTLLIVRELLLGPKRFSDLQAGLDGVSSSVLAQRLAEMEHDGLVRRSEQEPPAASTVYQLAAHGQALRPAVLELIRWGGRFLLPPRRGERFDPDWLVLALTACARHQDAPPHQVQLLVRKARRRDVGIHLGGGASGTTVDRRIAPAEVTIRGEPRAVFELAVGMVPPEQALDSGRLTIEGDRAIALLVPNFFDTKAASDSP